MTTYESFNIFKIFNISIFKSKLLSFICPFQSSIYNTFEPKGLECLTHLPLGLSHVNEHRFRHNFQDCTNPLCSCSLETEDTSYYLLLCHHFYHQRIDLASSIKSVSDNFESRSDNNKQNVLLYVDTSFHENKIYFRNYF